jgi:L-malate glycosyltransferase
LFAGENRITSVSPKILQVQISSIMRKGRKVIRRSSGRLLNMKKKSVLILCPSPRGTVATQRLKYEQYLGLLENEGYEFTISSFQTPRFWDIIYKPGRTLEKVFWTLAGYARRTFDLLRAPFYDAVFVNLWVTPLGLPVYERLLFFFNKRVIYDLDDMIFLSDGKGRNFIQKLKGKRKPIVLMKHAAHVIVCTPKLEEIAKSTNQLGRATDISSTFNTDRFVPVQGYEQHEVTTIGWTGTHSTLVLLELLKNVLQQVAAKRKIRLLVIANKEYKMEGVPTEFRYWSEDTEVKDLHEMEIGLYPIRADQWSLGKSSLKALTYMCIAIPVVATAYGTNFRIIEDGVDGLLAKDDADWVEKIVQLIDDVELRKRIGLAGRKKVIDQFSVEANFPKYLQVFKTVIK